MLALVDLPALQILVLEASVKALGVMLLISLDKRPPTSTLACATGAAARSTWRSTRASTFAHRDRSFLPS